MTLPERKFLSVAEVAAIVGCSKITVYRWLKIGAVPSVKIGGRRLVPSRAIKAICDPEEAA